MLLQYNIVVTCIVCKKMQQRCLCLFPGWSEECLKWSNPFIGQLRPEKLIFKFQTFCLPISDAFSIIFRLSLSHFTAAPAMATEPWDKEMNYFLQSVFWIIFFFPCTLSTVKLITRPRPKPGGLFFVNAGCSNVLNVLNFLNFSQYTVRPRDTFFVVSGTV